MVSFSLASIQSRFDQPNRLPPGISHSLSPIQQWLITVFSKILSQHHCYRSTLPSWQAFTEAPKVSTTHPLALALNCFRQNGLTLLSWQAFTDALKVLTSCLLAVAHNCFRHNWLMALGTLHEDICQAGRPLQLQALCTLSQPRSKPIQRSQSLFFSSSDQYVVSYHFDSNSRDQYNPFEGSV